MATVGEILKLVKLQHALFGLPLTLASMLLASGGLPRVSDALLIMLAFFSARSLGMGLNRLMDSGIDARNPRTSHRLLASGKVRSGAVWGWMGFFLILFVLACIGLHPLALLLLPVCVLLLVVYPLCKRYTVLAHSVLGLTLALGPVGAWVGIAGMPGAAILWFGLGVMTWVQGFDVIYALQDEEFDRTEGLFSIPARYGSRAARMFAAISHFLTPVCWSVSGLLFGLPSWFQAGMVVVLVLLLIEHWLIMKDRVRNLGLAFFRLNAGISLLVFILVSMAVL